jgi:Trehalase
MRNDAFAALREGARDVLARNRRGGWTCPASGIYRHQWLWDSCFVAIGLADSDPERAAAELRSVFRGQWANGMLPHIIFASGVADVGSRRIWQSKKHADAPGNIDTSCITQPPIVAIAVNQVSNALPTPERDAFLGEVLPRLVAYHSWLYRERDPFEHGLVTLIHPWECGLDTSPPWMHELAQITHPWWLRAALRLRASRLVRLLRTDTRYVPAAQRSSDDDGLRMLALARTVRRYDFEVRRMPPGTSLLIEDVAFNALLVVANRALEQIAHDVGRPLEPELQRRMSMTEAALEDLWDEPTGQYYSRNAHSGALITLPSVATFLALWAGTSPVRARRLVAQLQEPGWWPSGPIPSVPTDAAAFDPSRYWQGPTWVNMNWAIVQGLHRCGATELAEVLRRRTLELIARSGFAEYFSPLTGQGFGARNFSWTAALTLALLDEMPSPRPTG